MKGEIWKDITGYEGYYMVSNLGRVKSLERTVRCNRGYKTIHERILRTRKTRCGYIIVNLNQDGKMKTHYVHQLVATAFCENQMGYTEVNHINEDKSDNRAENIEWCSRSYNINYGTHNKRSAEKRRNDPNRSKPVIGVDKVTGLIVEFLSISEASRQLGINQGSLCSCLKGKLKSCGGFYWYYSNADNNDDAE